MITRTDLLMKIRQEDLDEITTDTALIDNQIMVAESIVRSMIPRYNLNVVDYAIKDVISTICVYKLFMLIAPNKIPISRVDEYEKALNYLKILAKGQVGTDLQENKDENDESILNTIESGVDDETSNLEMW